MNGSASSKVEGEMTKEMLSSAATIEFTEINGSPLAPSEEIEWWTVEAPLETAIASANGVKAKDSPLRVLIVQADLEAALILAKFFTQHGHQFWHATDGLEARTLLAQHQPEVVVLDLHLPDESGPDLLQYLRQQFPSAKVLFTTNALNSEQEAYAQAQGAQLFLRHTFTLAEVEQGWSELTESQPPTLVEPAFEDELPYVRLPMRLKITLPYVLLALLIALVGAYIVSRVVLESIEERFASRLIEVGQLTADWMVQEENRLLETLRLLAYTQGLSEAVAANDTERLRELVLPIVINYHEEAIEILDNQGQSILSLHHRQNGRVEDYSFSQGDKAFARWKFVQPILEQRVDEQGDKYAGLAQAPWGDYFYVAGPILDEEGQQVGVMLLGKSLATLVRQIQQDTLAHATIYNLAGRPLASTLSFPEDDPHASISPQSLAELKQQNGISAIRDLTVGSVDYAEVLGSWQARGDDNLGLMGASLAQTFLLHTSQWTRFQVFALVATAFLLVIAVGVFLANQITNPLLQMVSASAEVAQGNLDVKVESAGNDEVAVLSHSFNRMVSRLREGALYRDLLGRTVSPEIREELRQTFASGTLHLEGQNALATVLITDIRDFTTLSEKVDPPTILNWLNEYFGELVPIITSYGGVVNGFQGDALLAFFGILPRALTPQESAQRACLAAVDMLKAIEAINLRRARRSEPPLITGIGINTGIVIAGGLGSVDRLHYTILGDTVNTTKRLESLTRQFGDSGAIISQHTLLALGDWHYSFHTEPLGPHTVKGKAEQLQVYRLWPSERGVGVRETSDEHAASF
jgi:adenylate cyclase